MYRRFEEDLSVKSSIWGYRRNIGYQPETDLTGFEVEATDGWIGTVQQHSDESATGYIIVDSRTWISGKQVLLPAGTISSVDPAERIAYIDRSRDEIRDAPEFERDRHTDDADYQRNIDAYYTARLTP
jgi:hypothetical protein